MSEFKRRERNSLFSVCALAEGNIYAFTNFLRLPIKWNLQTEEIRLLEDIKDYDAQFIADFMINAENVLFVLELNGNRIMKYDIKQQTCCYFDIGCHRQEWGNYAALAKWENYLYIVPAYMAEIVKVEMNSGKVQRIRAPLSETNLMRAKQTKGDAFWQYGFQEESRIWLFQKQSSLVMEYDMLQNTWKRYELSTEINDCVHAVQYKGVFYLLSSEGRLYVWNKENNTIEVLADYSEKTVRNESFSRMVLTDKNIFLLPSLGNDIFCVDLGTKQIKQYNSYPAGFHYCAPEEWSKYYGYCEDEAYYYFAMRSTNFILTVNKQDGRVKWRKPQLPLAEEVERNYVKYNSSMFYDSIIYEQDCKMQSLLNYFVNDESCSRQEENHSLGIEIWERTKRG